MDRPTTPPTVSPGPTAFRYSRALEGWRGYGLAVLLAVIGATAAAVWAVTGMLDQIQRPDQFARTEVPGITSVQITRIGSHVIYVEAAAPVDLDAADLTVIGPQGAEEEVRPYALDVRYDVPGSPGQLGTAVAIFDAGGTGTFQVGTRAVAADGTKLAVGDDLAPEFIRNVAVPSTIGVLAVLAGIVMALATWIRAEHRNQS